MHGGHRDLRARCDGSDWMDLFVEVLSFFLSSIIFRSLYNLGRAGDVAETQWILEAISRVFQRSFEYLMSEHVGEMTLYDLVRDIV